MALVFMGTPAYALPVLEALLKGGFTVSAVYTQPDRPAGRGRGLRPSPVKEYALERGLPVFQPGSWRSAEALRELADQLPEAIVVVSYGKLLPSTVLHLSPAGCVNVHPSLLPKYRGPSPVVTALLEGETTTGVSLILLDEGMDTGPVLAQSAVLVEPDDTGGGLTHRLFQEGARLLVETLPRWLAGEIQPVSQDQSRATVTRRMSKEEGELDWMRPAAYLERQVRALDPWPGAYTFWKGKLLKVLEASVSEGTEAGNPGQAVLLGSGGELRLGVAAGDGGVLELRQVQLEGKRPVSGEEFLRGYRNFVGERLPSQRLVAN